MVNQEYFNSLLKGLQTEKGKNIAIIEAVENGITDKPEHIKTAVDYLEKRGVNGSLGIIYDQIGNHTYALEFYKKVLQEMENSRDIEKKMERKTLRMTQGKEFRMINSNIATLSGRIAIISKRWGEDEEAQEFYTKALQNYERVGEFKNAAELAEEMGDIAKTENYKALDRLLNPKCF